ncbi:hypothetical protein GM418_05925 [Maribellus comscasis]|uniref:Outer membrane protein beta-barrel domain-containing protein n=1 Tax=Maribellus comscasis TaxID=2681766 RepID=A0A6I6JV03_9BACT|nr:hypothetical protein [Maribellus comscasis]QGY43213.1 hypothetical protein GM418_05925 [Maribellus comscasis]
MKKVTGIVLLFFCLAGWGQDTDKIFYYLNSSLSVGNFSGGQLGFNLGVNERFSVQLEYSALARPAKEKPENYSGGLLSIFALGATNPTDKVQSFRVLGGVFRSLRPGSKTRINFKAGISFVTQSEAFNFVKDPAEGLFLVSNYSWENRKENRVGIVLKPEFETVFNHFAGLAVTPYLEINSQTTVGGLSIGLLLGKVAE